MLKIISTETIKDILLHFDEKIARVNTHSAKWDLLNKLYNIKPHTGLAMWVADMDFRAPPCVIDALKHLNDHGIFGYYDNDHNYKEAACQWMQRRHKWNLNPDHVFTTGGVVHAIALCIQTYTQPKDAVILFTPVYHAFARIIAANNRRIIECPLRNEGGRYVMDLARYKKIIDHGARMAILCSPHNPGGRVWDLQELTALANFCCDHNLILLSDEIHHDLVFNGNTHIPMPIAAPHIADRLITMTAASKTFNIAGTCIGNVSIEDDLLRKKFKTTLATTGFSPNNFGLAMAEAAYRYGNDWYDNLIIYLDKNRQIFDTGINMIAGMHSMRLEATYLAWVDFSDMHITHENIIKRVQTHAKIAGSHGATFGKGGENFIRFNLGMPRSLVEKAVKRLQNAFGDLQ